MPDQDSIVDQLGALRIDRTKSPASRPWKLFAVIGAVVAIAALGVFAWSAWRAPAAIDVTVVPVRVASAGITVGTSSLTASGYVVARRKSTVASRVLGRIERVYVDEGVVVMDGQLLATLESQTVRSQLALARNELQIAQANAREIQAHRVEASQRDVRLRQLAKEGHVSQAQLDVIAAEISALAAQQSGAAAQVERSKNNVSLKSQELDEHSIKAPFAGVVVSLDAQPGEIVSPASAGGGFTRTGIVTIVDMASREIEVDVNETYLPRVAKGQKVIATLDSYPDAPYDAQVLQIIPTADRAKATVKVRIGFEKVDDRVIPDMAVKARFMNDTKVVTSNGFAQPVLEVPLGALVTNAGGDAVYVSNDGTALLKPIVIGDRTAKIVQVISGLEAGEWVVYPIPESLRNNASIQIKRSP